MIEKQINEIWNDYLGLPVVFEVNAAKHFRMVAHHEYSELFESYRPEVYKTYKVVKNNLIAALLSDSVYIRTLADLIKKNPEN